MYKQYIKQAVQMLRENTLVSIISISGTALAIAMVLVMVLVFQIKSTGYAPESNRSRFMYVWGTEVGSKSPGGSDRNRGGMSSEVVKECFYTEDGAVGTGGDRFVRNRTGRRAAGCDGFYLFHRLRGGA